MGARFVARLIDRDFVEYRSRRTGITYKIGPDLSEYGNPKGFTAEAPGLLILGNSRYEVLSLIEVADDQVL